MGKRVGRLFGGKEPAISFTQAAKQWRRGKEEMLDLGKWRGARVTTRFRGLLSAKRSGQRAVGFFGGTGSSVEDTALRLAPRARVVIGYGSGG